MIVVEVLLTVAVVIGAVVLVIYRLTKPLWGAMGRRLRIESEAQRLAAERIAQQAGLRSEAISEVQEFLAKGGGGKLIGPGAVGLKDSIDPVLRAVLEKHPLDERVLELARVYRQATGKELLPERIRAAMAEPGEAGPASANLTPEEMQMLAEARREVECWAGSEKQRE